MINKRLSKCVYFSQHAYSCYGSGQHEHEKKNKVHSNKTIRMLESVLLDVEESNNTFFIPVDVSK